ncbi:MAG: hypothetical protein ACI4JB_06615 [Porcipelethomonas sp.]
MAYQIKKSSRITEELELLNESGKVEKTIIVDINVDRIAGGYRKAEVNLLNAQRNIKDGKTSEALESYGEAIVGLFRLVFEDENTNVILEYFDSNYTDMMVQVMPFINDVVRPAISAAVAAQKIKIANNFGFSKKQKRKLGLK